MIDNNTTPKAEIITNPAKMAKETSWTPSAKFTIIDTPFSLISRNSIDDKKFLAKIKFFIDYHFIEIKFLFP